MDGPQVQIFVCRFFILAKKKKSAFKTQPRWLVAHSLREVGECLSKKKGGIASSF